MLIFNDINLPTKFSILNWTEGAKYKVTGSPLEVSPSSLRFYWVHQYLLNLRVIISIIVYNLQKFKVTTIKHYLSHAK